MLVEAAWAAAKARDMAPLPESLVCPKYPEAGESGAARSRIDADPCEKTAESPFAAACLRPTPLARNAPFRVSAARDFAPETAAIAAFIREMRV